MSPRHRDHLRNGVAPVRGCAECAAMVRAAWRNQNKLPSGRLPPWIWDDDDDQDE